ncbi:MAG: ATP-binding protein, partial [Dehalococcoidia bacterium]
LVYVPMRSGLRIVGVLTLASSQRREVDRQELEFLETLAGQLGAQLEALLLHRRHDEERRRLQTIVESVPEAIAIATAEGRITTWNHVAEELWGHPPEETGLEKMAQAYGLCTPDGRPLPWQEAPLVRSLLQDTPSHGRELLIRRPDGSTVPILSNCVPVHDSQGKLSASVEVFQDIIRLKELDRLKDNFINTISHELRTPTTTIRGGALTLLRRGESLDDSTKRQLLRDMSEEAERLHILVEDLLTLSRAQAGMQLTTEPVIPHRFVNRMILELGGRVGDHTLTVDVPADLPMVEADLFCLEQVFRNLLENAVKFSPRGQRIELAARAGDGEVIFSVLDRGSGIPAKDLDRVFEPFYRTEEVIHAAVQGTGLGLAVCRRLVEMQGGHIWAETRAGGGTVFRFTVPSVGELVEEDLV